MQHIRNKVVLSRAFATNPYKSADRYSELARQQGYPARSVFKLIEIQQKFRLLRPGQHVLDLGCSPGSWTLYASKVVGSRGSVTAIDMHEFDSNVQHQRNVTFIKSDIFAWLQQYRQQQKQANDSTATSTPQSSPQPSQQYHVILSDMAPATSGNKDYDRSSSAHLCYAALYCADHLLRPSGHLVVKVLQGKDTQSVTSAMKKRFESVKSFKPESSRKNSTEMFLVGRNMTGNKSKTSEQQPTDASTDAPSASLQSASQPTSANPTDSITPQ